MNDFHRYELRPSLLGCHWHRKAGTGRGADGLIHTVESVSPKQLDESAIDAAGDRRTLVNQRGVKLHKRRAQANLLIRVLGGEDSATTDDVVSLGVHAAVEAADAAIDQSDHRSSGNGTGFFV